MHDLRPIHSNQKSYYGKAKVGYCGLISYSTIVVNRRVQMDDRIRYDFNGYYSATTGKHIREYMLQQIGVAVGKAMIDKYSHVFKNILTGELGWVERS